MPPSISRQGLIPWSTSMTGIWCAMLKTPGPDVGLELQVSVTARRERVPWDTFARTSGNPLIPTVQEAMDQVLSPQEADRFIGHLRPLVESGTGERRTARAYLTTAKS